MLKMSSFLIEQQSTEKSYTVPFKEVSLCLSFIKSFDMLPFYVFLCFKFVNLCFTYKVTFITIVI